VAAVRDLRGDSDAGETMNRPVEIDRMTYLRCSICGSDRTTKHPRFAGYLYCRSCKNKLWPSEMCPNDEQCAEATAIMRKLRE